MKVYNVHAGHGLSGGKGSGAVGILDESTEARKVKTELIRLLRESGNTVYDCTYEGNADQDTILVNIVKKCNQHDVDLDISIHLNSGRNDVTGDGSTGGVEVYGYDNDVKDIGERICNAISNSLDIRNRGFKINTELYVLRKTYAKALLIECCFVDDKDDANKWNTIKCATAICEALINNKITQSDNVQPRFTSSLHYRAYIQGKGWDDVKQSGEVAGTVGQSLRLEAIKIDYPNHEIYAKAHIQGDGWKDYGQITSDTIIGTTEKAKRLECICLKGDFKYRVHIQKFGWTPWTQADGIVTLGTVGQSLRLEAIQLEEK